MINISFWKRVKEKWIRDEDPTKKATDPFISGDDREEKEINDVYLRINNINSTLEQLNGFGNAGSPFGKLYTDDDE